jgi:hypothetical protein
MNPLSQYPAGLIFLPDESPGPSNTSMLGPTRPPFVKGLSSVCTIPVAHHLSIGPRQEVVCYFGTLPANLRLRGKLRDGEIKSEKTFREVSEHYLREFDAGATQ